MLEKNRILSLLREQSPYLEREFGVRRIGLFGSFAGGRPNDESDIDLLVEFERPIGLRFLELAEYLENLLGRKVDLLTPAGLQAIRHQQVTKTIKETLVYV